MVFLMEIREFADWIPNSLLRTIFPEIIAIPTPTRKP
jgi:hypothetical protein